MPRYHLPLLGVFAAARFGPVPAGAQDDPPGPPESLIAMQFTDDPYEDRDHTEMILSGELGLAGIRYGPGSFAPGVDGYGADVHGEFCAFDPSLNRKDPGHYPTIDEVMSESDHCGEHRYSLPLREVARAVADAADRPRIMGGPAGGRPLPVSGLLFHEGHAGAGLVSNSLATFDSARMVSEHPAVRDALAACDLIKNRYKSEDCDPAKRLQVLEDVVSLLSRTSAGDSAEVRHFFLKVDGASAAYLHEMRSLFPKTKWAFAYRRADDALAKATQRKRVTACLKARRNPSAALSAKAKERGVDLEGLSPQEVCALQLSTLLDAATREHDETRTGMLISYDDDINANANSIVTSILPYFGLQREIESDPFVEDRVRAVLSYHADTRSKLNPNDKKWDKENVEVTDDVAAASNAFMSDSMVSITRSHARM